MTKWDAGLCSPASSILLWPHHDTTQNEAHYAWVGLGRKALKLNYMYLLHSCVSLVRPLVDFTLYVSDRVGVLSHDPRWSSITAVQVALRSVRYCTGDWSQVAGALTPCAVRASAAPKPNDEGLLEQPNLQR